MITSVYCPAWPSRFQRSQSCFSPLGPALLFDPLSLVMLLRSLGGPDSDIRCLVWLDGNMNLHRNFIIKYVHREAKENMGWLPLSRLSCYLKAGSLTEPFQLGWPAGELWICLSLSPSAVVHNHACPPHIWGFKVRTLCLQNKHYLLRHHLAPIFFLSWTSS